MTFKPGDKVRVVDSYPHLDYLVKKHGDILTVDKIKTIDGNTYVYLAEETDSLWYYGGNNPDRFELVQPKKKHEGLLLYGTNNFLSSTFLDEDELKSALKSYGYYEIGKDLTEIDIYELRYVKTIKKTPVEKTITIQEWK